MWQLQLAQSRKKIVYLGLEARDLAADNQNREAYGKYLEVLEIAGNSDPGTEETRRFVETAKTESERLLPIVHGQLDSEKVQAQVQVREFLERIGLYVGVALGVGALLLLIILTAKADAKRHALSTKCPYCQKLSAVYKVGETVLSETPRIKTVTQRRTGVAMFDGQFIPTISSEGVQVIVYDIVYRNTYKCRFCNEESMSQPLEREVQP